jgi:hypothetical protein
LQVQREFLNCAGAWGLGLLLYIKKHEFVYIFQSMETVDEIIANKPPEQSVVDYLKVIKLQLTALTVKLDRLPEDLLKQEYELDDTADLAKMAVLPFKSMDTAMERFNDKHFRTALFKSFKVNAPRDVRIIPYFFSTLFADPLLKEYFWPTSK